MDPHSGPGRPENLVAGKSAVIQKDSPPLVTADLVNVDAILRIQDEIEEKKKKAIRDKKLLEDPAKRKATMHHKSGVPTGMVRVNSMFHEHRMSVEAGIGCISEFMHKIQDWWNISVSPLLDQLWKKLEDDEALFLFGTESKIRRHIRHFVMHRAFTAVIYLCIVVNTICLVLYEPASTSWLQTTFLKAQDLASLIVFSVEILLKMISFGALFAPHSYLRSSSWNRMDFIVVACSWFSEFADIGVKFSAFRALRCLRPLRAVRFLSAIRDILSSLARSLTLLMDVMSFLLFFFLLFGIIGLNFFGASLQYRCTVTSTGDLAIPNTFCSLDGSGFTCPTGQTCSHYGNPAYGILSFDNLGQAFMILFEAMSMENWTPIMYAVMDGENAYSAVPFFILIILLLSFIVINLFIAVLSGSFSKIRAETKGSAFSRSPGSRMNLRTLLYVRSLILLSSMKSFLYRFLCCTGRQVIEQPAPQLDLLEPPSLSEEEQQPDIPKGKLQRLCYRMMTHSAFSAIMVLMVSINTGLMASRGATMTASHELLLKYTEIVFTAIFLFEAVVKILGSNGFPYFRSFENCFDFSLVTITVVGISIPGASLNFILAFRSLRMIRLLRVVKGIRSLVKTALSGIVPVLNLVIFIVFSLVVFSVLAVQLFGEYANDEQRPNFRTFSSAFLALFQVLSQDNWSDVLNLTVFQSNYSPVAFIFFIFYFPFSNCEHFLNFSLFSMLLYQCVALFSFPTRFSIQLTPADVLLNLFTAVILENFEMSEEEKQQQQQLSLVSNQQSSFNSSSSSIRRSLAAFSGIFSTISDINTFIAYRLCQRDGFLELLSIAWDFVCCRRRSASISDAPSEFNASAEDLHNYLKPNAHNLKQIDNENMYSEQHKQQQEQQCQLTPEELLRQLSADMSSDVPSSPPQAQAMSTPGAVIGNSPLLSKSDLPLWGGLQVPRATPSDPISPAAKHHHHHQKSPRASPQVSAAGPSPSLSALKQTPHRSRTPPPTLVLGDSFASSADSVAGALDRHNAEISTFPPRRPQSALKSSLRNSMPLVHDEEMGDIAEGGTLTSRKQSKGGVRFAADVPRGSLSSRNDAGHHGAPVLKKPVQSTIDPDEIMKRHSSIRLSRQSSLAPSSSFTAAKVLANVGADHVKFVNSSSSAHNVESPSRKRTLVDDDDNSDLSLVEEVRLALSDFWFSIRTFFSSCCGSARRNTLLSFRRVLASSRRLRGKGNQLASHGSSSAPSGATHRPSTVEAKYFRPATAPGAASSPMLESDDSMKQLSMLAASASMFVDSPNDLSLLDDFLNDPKQHHHRSASEPPSPHLSEEEAAAKRNQKQLRRGTLVVGIPPADDSNPPYEDIPLASKSSMTAEVLAYHNSMHQSLYDSQSGGDGAVSALNDQLQASQPPNASPMQLQQHQPPPQEPQQQQQQQYPDLPKAPPPMAVIDHLTRALNNNGNHAKRVSMSDVGTPSQQSKQQAQMKRSQSKRSSYSESGSSAGESNYGSSSNLGMSSMSLATATYDDETSEEIVLCLLGPHNPIRTYARDLASHRYFERFVLFAVLVSSIFLAFETPPEALKSANDQDDSTTLGRFFAICDTIFLAIFTLEAGLKILAMGLLFKKKAYLRDSWNCMDAFLLLTMYLASSFPFIRSIRILRTLRPLRVVRKLPGLRVIVLALWNSLPAILYVSLLSTFVIFLFSIIGIGLFAGQFGACNDASVANKAECIGTFSQALAPKSSLSPSTTPSSPITMPRVWSVPFNNFDDIGSAVATLFQVSTRTSWTVIMYSAMDITDVDQQPQTNNSPANAVFFLVFMIIGAFFMMNLFVGVIIENVNRQRGISFLTTEQRQWVDLQRILMILKPERAHRLPSSTFRRFCFRMIASQWFEFFILGCVMLNVIAMALDYDGASDSWQHSLKTVNYVFVGIFAAELVLKIFGLGLRAYFSDSWNSFDAFLVAGSLVAIGIEASSASINPAVFTVSRIFRIGRIFRILRKAKGIKFLFDTIMVSLPSVANISMLMLLLLFIYAVIGVQLFGNMRYQSSINRQVNFRSFPNALLLLFRLVTLDNWSDIWQECTLQPPYCTSNSLFDDCGSAYAFGYFASFILTGAYVFLNLVIVVILDNFQSCYNRENPVVPLEYLEEFKDTWRKFDPDRTGRIPVWAVRHFVQYLHDIGNPLGLDVYHNRLQFSVMRYELLTMKKRRGGVPFLNVAKMFCARLVSREALTLRERSAQTGMFTHAMEYIVATAMASAYRGHMERKRIFSQLTTAQAIVLRRIREKVFRWKREAEEAEARALLEAEGALDVESDDGTSSEVDSMNGGDDLSSIASSSHSDAVTVHRSSDFNRPGSVMHSSSQKPQHAEELLEDENPHVVLDALLRRGSPHDLDRSLQVAISRPQTAASSSFLSGELSRSNTFVSASDNPNVLILRRNSPSHKSSSQRLQLDPTSPSAVPSSALSDEEIEQLLADESLSQEAHAALARGSRKSAAPVDLGSPASSAANSSPKKPSSSDAKKKK